MFLALLVASMFLHASIPLLRRGVPVLLGDLNDNMPKIWWNRSRESPPCDTVGLFKNYHSSWSLTPEYCLTMLIILKSHPVSWVWFFIFSLTFIWISLIPSIHAPSYKFTVFVIFYILNILERKFHPYQPGTMSLYPMSKQPRSKHYLPGLLQINPDSSYPQT